MSDSEHVLDISLTPVDNRRLASLCGRFDEHLRQIESRLGIEISNRGHSFQLTGPKKATSIGAEVLKHLYKQSKDSELTPAEVHLCLQQHGIKDTSVIEETQETGFSVNTRAGVIRARSPNQKLYIENILTHDVIFGIGPAGTGKTYLAVACAVAALEQEKIRRIILVRPAVEAGERLGFLPGDLSQKIDPYLRPLYDALYEMLGFEKVSKLLEKQVIEIASLAYMRGRTLNDSFIILDEGQNSTVEQMKMFLTRLGFGSTAVITGDITQIDLPRGKQSGLKQIIRMLDKIPKISFNFFESSDVVRHPVVQEIIEAYERFEAISDESSGDSGEH